ncbi:SCO2525 family SAM-dependent methyltransferase [Streptomyces sp. NPDC002734]|uniref:SCO2525 family SAM-dependent methyltransferase n=1 Tax=Streptomyces sp. NPDC002734 TaxID=3154426 RepID=UPI00331FC610
MALNSEAPWDEFCPNDYVKRNYADPLDVDKRIVHLVGEHFTAHFTALPGEGPRGPVRGVDVGAGANLYPALCMLPWCSEITLLEKGPRNLDYLQEQLEKGFDPAWNAFWRVLAGSHGPYKDLDDQQRMQLKEVAELRKDDLLTLNQSTERWGLGAMFFVAESMSSSGEEFRTAIAHFLGALEPGAPFAAAFMLKSKGYEVGDHEYPAYPVNQAEVAEALESMTEHVVYHELDIVLREGHDGMLLALGFRGTD